jgi:hypothetical protein
MKFVAAFSLLALALPLHAQSGGSMCPLNALGHREVTIAQADDGSLSATPDTCHVKPGEVLDFAADDAFEFDLDFSGSTPDANGQKKFHSDQQKVQVKKVKKPAAQDPCPYVLTLSGAAGGTDPTVIVDPK